MTSTLCLAVPVGGVAAPRRRECWTGRRWRLTGASRGDREVLGSAESRANDAGARLRPHRMRVHRCGRLKRLHGGRVPKETPPAVSTMKTVQIYIFVPFWANLYHFGRICTILGGKMMDRPRGRAGMVPMPQAGRRPLRTSCLSSGDRLTERGQPAWMVLMVLLSPLARLPVFTMKTCLRAGTVLRTPGR